MRGFSTKIIGHVRKQTWKLSYIEKHHIRKLIANKLVLIIYFLLLPLDCFIFIYVFIRLL